MDTPAVEIMPATETKPAVKPAFEATLSDILAAAQAQVAESKKVIVTDPTDVDGIKLSREFRLALRRLRCSGNDAHKEGKADILRAGRAIDGMKNIILQVCEPEEARLLAQEEIAERIQAERKAKVREERQAVLVDLGENPAFHGPFEEFPLEDWNQRIAGIRAAKQAREEQAHKEAEEAARKAKEEQEERERIKAENARLKAEADAREAAMKAERDAAEKAIRMEREEAEKAIRAERARAKEIEDAARAEAAKIAQERAKVEAEARAEEEQEREAKRKAEAAPDREKLMAFAYDVAEMKLPPMGSLDARTVRLEIESRLHSLAAWIREKAGEL